MSDLDKINSSFKNKINSINSKDELQNLKTEFFGKNGQITAQFKKLSSLSSEEKKYFASSLNNLKNDFNTQIESKILFLETKEINEKLKDEKIDITLPIRTFIKGKIHPVSQVIDEISSIFSEIGFSVAEGPDVETEHNNFTALNTPEDHPARDMHDTFYLEENKKTLLRTHTSPVQIRTMINQKPPIRIIAPGRTFRSDDDATHSPMFHQVEGLVIEKAVNMGHLKGLIKSFCEEFFEISDLPVRFRPSYFPFTEPSAEVDISYSKRGNSINIGKGSDWLEVMGCGMVHPKVLINCGLDPEEWQGFAFGLGVERFAMLKYGIADLRNFYEGDIRWLDHYGFSNEGGPSHTWSRFREY